MKTRILSATIIATTILLFLSACARSTPLPTSAPTSTAAAIPQVMADCFISFKVAAWLDLNGDSIWDSSEPPLEGVEYQLGGMFAQKFDPVLDSQKGEGWYSIQIWSPGECIEQDYTVTAIPPESFEATTPSSITFSGSLPYEAQFGFRAVSP